MSGFLMLSVVILLLIAAGIVLLLKTKKPKKIKGKYPEGYFMAHGMGMGIAIGMPIGILIGISMDNLSLGIALGPAIGTAIGVAIGSILESKNKNKIRNLTKAEKKQKRLAKIVGMIILGLGILVFASAFFLVNNCISEDTAKEKASLFLETINQAGYGYNIDDTQKEGNSWRVTATGSSGKIVIHIKDKIIGIECTNNEYVNVGSMSEACWR